MRKFLPYILILITLVGLFSPTGKAEAAITVTGCYNIDNVLETDLTSGGTPLSQSQCEGMAAMGNYVRWVIVTGTPPTDPCVGFQAGSPAWRACDAKYNPSQYKAPTENQSEFVKNLETCLIAVKDGLINVPGCIKNFFYYVFYQVPAFLLWLCAYFFNVLISVSLSSSLFTDPFVSKAWTVVRDLSNIFFILILLYIAVKIILGMKGHDVKNMIVQVIIMALLINFSMFFTGVVIDTSNILAMIFYNKLDVCVNRDQTTNKCRPYDSAAGEKDVAGAMVSAFDPTSRLNEKFFEQAKIRWVNGQAVPNQQVPVGTMIGLILIAGLVMGVAAYALFISGLSFVGRLIELWVLIIFSPFAFMSSTVPHLSGIEYLGWKAWCSRLIKTAFMAPVFMFFLYFIFLLIQSNLFSRIVTPGVPGTQDAAAVIKTLLGIVLPTILIVLLLLKATEFAKKGSGMAGEFLTKVGGAVGGVATGLALGAATGGAGLALRGVVGAGGGALANKSASLANRIGATKYGGALGFNRLASGLTSAGALAQRSSFDLRGVKIGGKSLASVTGIPIGEAQKGGVAQSRKEKVEKRMKRADLLKVREDEGLKQALNKAEMELQQLLNDNAHNLHELDTRIKDARESLADAHQRGPTGAADVAKFGAELENAKADKSKLRTDTGIKALQAHTIPNAKLAVEAENRRRKVAFANRTARWGGKANREAQHKIIMESKISESRGEAH